MYQQLTLFDKEEKKKIEIPKSYASPCGGCICENCANNVDCVNAAQVEMKEQCFNCDECYYYNHYGKINKKRECNDFFITEAGAKRLRKQIVNINKKV